MNTTDNTLHITGDMAEKIKNNVHTHIKQFSWMLTFPKKIAVTDVDTEKMVIVNKDIQRLRTEFVVNPKKNTILVSPQTEYKPDHEYFFCAKYKNKELCIAFTVSEAHELVTFDQKVSLERLNKYCRRKAARAAREKALNAAPKNDDEQQKE